MRRDREETVGNDVETGKSTVVLRTMKILVYRLEGCVHVCVHVCVWY